jgi:MoaA/NifB/PqqE/SkfB family radical SAM enzyme
MKNNKTTIMNSIYESPPALMGSSFSKNDILKARTNSRILSVSLLLSNVCNLNCLYCYRDAGKTSQNALSIDDWKDVLLQCKKQGARSVRIPGSGEPFLDPSFFKGDRFGLIEFSNSIGLPVTFFTNGTHITKDIAYLLRQYDVCVVAKLNSFRAEVQDYLAGVRGTSLNIMSGINHLIDAGFNSEIPTRLGIDTVIVSRNYDEIPTIFKYCRNNNIVPYITANLHAGRACNNSHLDISKRQLMQLFYELLETDQIDYGYDWFPSPPIVAGQCDRLLYDIVIDFKGDVFFCPGIDISIGNILEQPLSTIMTSSDLLRRVRSMDKYLIGKCATCGSDSCSYGCRLEAWANGDLFGPDPMCWH